ncbi:MAG TPA: hypothetical protein VHY84_27305 [Bryobacteraceae bacterium]|jgi:hypothetical protein|nr:hypothetical protein [Bryobacteraceae bacterium]
MITLLEILTSKITAGLGSTAIVGLFASAEVNTAPDSLPALRDFPQWLYGWQLHAARVFLNLRNPAPPVSTRFERGNR